MSLLTVFFSDPQFFPYHFSSLPPSPPKGWETNTYCLKQDGWLKCVLAASRDEPRNPHKVTFRSCQEAQVERGDFFEMLKEFEAKRYVMCCSTKSGTDSKEDSKNGIVQGHAYTLIGAHEVEGHKIVQLRNPWGSFEWNGAWSDESDEWADNPKVKEALEPTVADDGIFYMSYADFMCNYEKVDVCQRADSLSSTLFLKGSEDDDKMGPCSSCLSGFLGYFVKGDGVAHICRGEYNETEEKKWKFWKRSIKHLKKNCEEIFAEAKAAKAREDEVKRLNSPPPQAMNNV